MNNENRKIVKYDPNTGAPIYEEVPVQVQPEPVVDNSRFQPQQNNSFEQPVQQPMQNNYQQSVQQPMQNNYQQPVQQPMQNNYQQPQYQQPMMQQMPMQQPMMNQYQPQNNLNQTSYQPSYETKKGNKGLIIGIIIGIIVLIAAAIVGYFAFFNGNDDKKADGKDTKPTTTINDYDDDDDDIDIDDYDDDDDDDDIGNSGNNGGNTSSSYEDNGHFRYYFYPGYEYEVSSSSVTVAYNMSDGFAFGEFDADLVFSYMDTEENFVYFLSEIGFLDASNFEKYDDGEITILFCNIKDEEGNSYRFFLTDAPGYYNTDYDYVIMGIMTDYTASNTSLAKYIKNVFSYAEEL